jgi:hypothetical protein
MEVDLDKGDAINGAIVVKRYHSGLGSETAVLQPGRHTDEDHLIKEMRTLGWAYHFTRDATGKMFFRDADNWEMEPGAGNS